MDEVNAVMTALFRCEALPDDPLAFLSRALAAAAERRGAGDANGRPR